MAVHDEPIWDGNGGSLDPSKSSQRDFLVALHVKMDKIVIPALRDLQEFQRKQESGDLTRAQTLAVKEVIQDGNDERLERKSMRMPTWAVVIAALALIANVVYTVSVVRGG